MVAGDGLDGWLSQTTFPEPGTSIRCGVSGGADSLALLALATAARCHVTAVHVDHGIRPNSAAEADLVASYAHDVGASFEAAMVNVAPGPNLEARMRAARYGVLGPEAATGHTLDDQAETVLLNLMRGSGIRGLGAMQPGPRRPILGLRRHDTEAVCAAMGWQPFTDPSNVDPAFRRNRVRAELMPLLCDIAQRDVVPLLARTAEHARETQAAVDEIAGHIDPTDAMALRDAPQPAAASAIQHWIRSETGDEYAVDSASIERVLGVVHGAAVAAEVTGGWRVERSKQRLTIRPAQAR